MNRVFVVVLDGFGIGELPDAVAFGDKGSDTLGSCAKSSFCQLPNLTALGLFNIDGVCCGAKAAAPTAAFGRMAELSQGKDTTVGHWELMGEVSVRPFPTYPKGFPKAILETLEAQIGRKILCNLPYSGTKVLEDYGREQIESAGVIVYTSADSVFQIAAHEAVVPVEELYEICEKARAQLTGEHAVARVIARPFAGRCPNFVRTPRRHDFSLAPQGDTVLDRLMAAGKSTIGVGKIYDIFAGKGVSQSFPTASNLEGLCKTRALMDETFTGLCFVNLVDTDMLYGHRNDCDGFAQSLAEFDGFLPQLLEKLKEDDLLILTADHGCDPGTPSTDHSREYVPMLAVGKGLSQGVNLHTLAGFSHVGGTVLAALGVDSTLPSFYHKM